MRNYCDILNTSEGLRVWDGLKMWNVIMNQPEEYINQDIDSFFIICKI